jgi:SNF2 family DNA or RNA helicase
MTGTPAPKDHCDWWAQCEVTYPGWLRESNVHGFRRRLANIEKVDGPYGSFPKLVSWKEDEVELLGRRLKGLVHRVTREDADLDLPPVEYDELSLPPNESMVRAARTLALTANAGIDLLEKLRQLADGISYRDDGVVTAEVPKDKKLQELLDLYEDAGRFGIYAGYTASVDKCAALAASAGWEVLRVDGRGMHVINGKRSAQEALAACQVPGAPDDKLCFVGQPGAGGVGLNLQGLSGLCFYSNTFNGGDRQQAEARPQRIGNKGLRIYDLLCLPTDVLVLRNLKAKRDAQELVLGELRAAILGESS